MLLLKHSSQAFWLAVLLSMEHGQLASLLFSCPASDARSWRTPKFSDWTLVLGDRKYMVHKTILGEGVRESQYFSAQFQHWEQNGRATDLAVLLPDACWDTVEPLLDYFYDGALELQASTQTALFKCKTKVTKLDLFQRVRESRSRLGISRMPENS